MPKKNVEFDPEYVRDISLHVYEQRMALSGKDAVAKMVAKDGDGGVKLRSRASAYDDLTRCYLRAIRSVAPGCFPEPDYEGDYDG